VDARHADTTGVVEGDSLDGGFEPRPPTFTELVEAITNLWNPRTQSFYTREEAKMIAWNRRGYIDG
jgi:hypothetical protein